MAVDYSDPRFQEVETQKQEAMTELNQTYDGMIGATDQHYQSQIDAIGDYAETQKKLQQEQTDFAIEQVEQQKEQAKKDYTKEQAGAYVDWKKQSNAYGVNAERLAAQGMTKSGYSESAQVSMYNAYQNRVATAKESYDRAALNYDNAVKEARLQNSSILAEIAFNALQSQLQLGLQGFEYKNSLILAKADKKTELDNMYYQRSQNVLNQINSELALAEQKRQFDVQMAKSYSSGGSGSGGYAIGKDNGEELVKAEETNNTKLFAASVMRPRETSRLRGKIYGKSFSSYRDYISIVMQKWYGEGKLNESEVSYLKAYYDIED